MTGHEDFTIATWNLWNTPERQQERLEAAAETLRDLAPDVVALQEVATSIAGRPAADLLAEACGYRHVLVHPYPDDPGEALAILSRYPIARIEAPELAAFALRVVVDAGSARLALTNVHLDYSSVAGRERQIRALIRQINAESLASHYEVLAGDFNATPDSSVYRFLQEQQTLDGTETVSWHDLALLAASRSGIPAPPTLDMLTNPRWHEAPTLQSPMRLDWILVRDVFAAGLPSPVLGGVTLIGTEPAGPASVAPSDHYGVVATLRLPMRADLETG
jgi:endonuclease/exonuclease/phosphatase family metal-dependent hydrolase